MVHDLHVLARVHAREVREDDEAELGIVVERAHDVGQVGRVDADLGLVVTLPDGAREALAEASLEPPSEEPIHA